MGSEEASGELSEKIVKAVSEDNANIEKGITIWDAPPDSFETRHGVGRVHREHEGCCRDPRVERRA